MSVSKQLICVYNANSGVLNALADVAHKFFQPSTYNCNLCALTYGLVSEKNKWKNFRKKSEIPMKFLYIDEYEKQYKSKFAVKYDYPVILIQDHYTLDIFLSKDKINKITTLDDLIVEIKNRWKR